MLLLAVLHAVCWQRTETEYAIRTETDRLTTPAQGAEQLAATITAVGLYSDTRINRVTDKATT